MKPFLKTVAAAALLCCALPVTLLAQTEKEKEKAKEKGSRQQIVITRTGDKDEKTVIEIEGDKVKVNGKDVADAKDVHVHLNNLNSLNAMTFRSPAKGFDSFDETRRLMKVDSNRAMLGINSNGHEKGVEISSIVAGTAAEKAGLKKGDVITKIDNRRIQETDDVTDAVRAHKPGDKVTVTYLRDEKEYKATAELGHWKGMDVRAMTAPKLFDTDQWLRGYAFDKAQWGFDSLQMRVDSLHTLAYGVHRRARAAVPPGVSRTYTVTGSFRPKLGLSVQDTDDGKGVKVVNLTDDGAAEKSGVKEDDVITQIDGTAVNSADDAAKLIKEKKDQPLIRLQLLRNGKPQTIEVKIPRKLKTADL